VLRPNTQVTAWVALDDVDVSNGCMSMVPGSHLWGDQMAFLRTAEGGFELPKEYEGKPVEVVSRPVAKGEVHYHHSLTWHGSHNNTSGRPRRAIAIHLMGGDTEFVASGNHPMKKFVSVADGEKLEGDAFPVVYRRSA
jgi:ectoine hydroxylase-related dioxygenase (phytanoyl-CoA dioxygenase family)